MNVAFLLSDIAPSRFYKRISSMKCLGINPLIFSFERGKYEGKTSKCFEYISMGRIQNEKYWRRLVMIRRAIGMVENCADKVDVLYAFGFDNLLIALFANRKISARKIIYEVGDIRKIFIGERLINKVARFIQRWAMRYVDLLVVTSKAFVESYFIAIQGMKKLNYIVVENKLDISLFPNPKHGDRRKKSNKKCIGYIGNLRCARTLDILNKIAAQGSDKIQIYIRGIPSEHLEQQFAKLINKANVKYEGAYIVPDDLPEIYGQIDMMWACYPYSRNLVDNNKWARTNRFYEGCYYITPIICQTGSEDGKVVQKFDIGCCIDQSNIDDAAESILNVKTEDIDRWKASMRNLDFNVYVYNKEHEILLKKLGCGL